MDICSESFDSRIIFEQDEQKKLIRFIIKKSVQISGIPLPHYRLHRRNTKMEQDLYAGMNAYLRNK